jgi:hypothetical protein
MEIEKKKCLNPILKKMESTLWKTIPHKRQRMKIVVA